MIVRRNLTYFNSDARQIIQSNQQLGQSEDLSHFINFPRNTLNPQTPITSRLMNESIKHANLLKMQKQDSEFSFKQKNDFLIEEKPVQFDDLNESREKPVFFIKNFEIRKEKIPTNETIKSTIERSHLIDPFPIYQQAKVKVKSDKPIERERIGIGKFTNVKQPSNYTSFSIDRFRSQSEFLQQAKIVRPHHNSSIKNKLNETLNKIKSLNISTKAEEERGSSILGKKLRYSTAKISDQPKFSDSRVQDNSTLGDNFYPIKKQVISSIKRHVQKMNGSIAKDPKRVIPHQEQESNSPLILFKKDGDFEQSSSRQAQQNIQPKSKSFIISKTNKKTQNSNSDEPIIISYKTTLLQLKQLSTQFTPAIKIKVKIPDIFSSPLFQQTDDQHQLFAKAGFIIKELQIESSNFMTIRKYSNCVIVLIDVIAILSYFSGHVYFGGWASGSKQGLGFEWLPGKFVYYGEYNRNKREGYGVFKNREGQTLLGKWKGNRFLQTL